MNSKSYFSQEHYKDGMVPECLLRCRVGLCAHSSVQGRLCQMSCLSARCQSSKQGTQFLCRALPWCASSSVRLPHADVAWIAAAESGWGAAR